MTTTNSEKATTSRIKPDKPKDFALTPHANGQWCKKIKGVVRFFGVWADPEAALAKYLKEKDYWQAGQTPPAEGETKLTMVALCEQFMESKQTAANVGKIGQRQVFDYHRCCKQLLAMLGKSRFVESLRPADFDALAAKMGKGVASTTLANRIRLARVVFRFASDTELIEKPLNFGKIFVLPDKSQLRIEKNKRPALDFKADELRAIIDAAKSPIKAMILLGINCGFGNTDCGSLPTSAIDIKSGWIDFPRPKTGVARRCSLWPETIKALRDAQANRPEPWEEEHAGLVFITKYGNPYSRLNEVGTNLDALAGEFAKILSELKLSGNRRGFYSLRRTFETVAGESLDQVAVDFIMGHAPAANDMAAVYRQSISDERLIKVTDFVRGWLWPKKSKGSASKVKK